MTKHLGTMTWCHVIPCGVSYGAHPGLEEPNLPRRLIHTAGQLVLAVDWELGWAVGVEMGGQVSLSMGFSTRLLGLPPAR